MERRPESYRLNKLHHHSRDEPGGKTGQVVPVASLPIWENMFSQEDPFLMMMMKLFLEYIKLSASILKTTFLLQISSV